MMRALALICTLATLSAGCDSAAPGSGVGDLILTFRPPSTEGNQLLIQTEEAYPDVCTLGVEVDRGPERIVIEVTGAPSEACYAATGPHSALVALPDGDIAGYRVEIRKDGERDRYELGWLGDELPLQLQGSGTFTTVVPPVMTRGG